MPRKRILFVRPTMDKGGADRVTLQLLKYLARSEYEPHLALMKKVGVYLDDIPKDVPVYDLKARSLWTMWWPLFWLLKRNGFDVVFATCGGTSIPLMVCRYLVLHPKYIVSERSALSPPHHSTFKQVILNSTKRFLYSKASIITVVSGALKSQMEQNWGINGEKILPVFNPLIDEHLINAKDEFVSHPFFNKQFKILLAAGRMEYQKDYPSLIHAFKEVQQIIPNARLLILGEGPYRTQLEQLVKDLGLEEWVSMPGFDKNPFKYMSKANVFVLSSRHEGMPGVLIQAMACGAACVSTDCPTGPNEVITDGENGYLVPIEESKTLSERIIHLLENDTLRQQFKLKAPSAVKRFHYEEGMQSYITAIEA